jgi:spore germination protein GerM
MNTRPRLLLAIVLLVGCGARTDTFHPIDKGDVAAAIKAPLPTTTTSLPKPSSTSATTTTTLPPTTTAPTTTPPTTTPSEDVFLYFVGSDSQHVRVVRDRRALPVTPIDVLKSLQTPPKSDPTLRTLIAPGLVKDVKVDRSADVTLSADLLTKTPEEQRLIGAQLTLTLTQLRGISLVRFLVDNADVTLPAAPDREDSIFRGQSDYSALVAR